MVSISEGFLASSCAAIILEWGLLFASKNLQLPEWILYLVLFWETKKIKRWKCKHHTAKQKLLYPVMANWWVSQRCQHAQSGNKSMFPVHSRLLLLLHLLPSCLLNCAQGFSFIWWFQFYSDLFSINGNLKYWRKNGWWH